LAKLVPLDDGKPAGIRFGLMKGQIHIEPDFNTPLDAFELSPSSSAPEPVRDCAGV